MPSYGYDLFNASYYIRDTPIYLATPYGPPMRATLTYFQDAKHNIGGSGSKFSKLGDRWFLNWFSYVDVQDSGDTLVFYLPDGRRETHRISGSAFPVHQMSQAKPASVTGGYERVNPDGSKMVYTHDSVEKSNRYYLKQVVDQQGVSVTLTYDDGPGDDGDRITEVSDTFGRKLVFEYNETDAYLVSKVREKMGTTFYREAAFSFTSGQLTAITDMGGIDSSFVYGDGTPHATDFIEKMTTPYGDTEFEDISFQIQIDDDPVVMADYRGIEITDPEGLKETILYGPDFNTTDFPGLNASSPLFATTLGDESVTGAGIFYNAAHGLTLYWDKKANKHTPPVLDPQDQNFGKDFDKARATQWYVKDDDDDLAYPYAMSTRTTETFRRFIRNSDPLAGPPSGVSVIVENELGNLVERKTTDTYNALGNIETMEDPVGRKIKLTHANNDIDVTKVEVWNKDDFEYQILAEYEYPTTGNLHLPTTVTDASGYDTTVEYNAYGQVTSITNAKGEQVLFTYGYVTGIDDPDQNENDGFLTKIEIDQDGSGTSHSPETILTLTYHSSASQTGYAGLVDRTTGATGYWSENDYDALGRVIRTDFQDGKFELYNYDDDYLDPTSYRNREGQLATYTYNGNRQLTSVLDPERRLTQIVWCACGDIEKLIDALGRTTEWKRDPIGRVTKKTLPDEKEITYAYEAESGLLWEVTYPEEQGEQFASIRYDYYVDGRLFRIDYPTAASPYTADTFAEYTYDDVLGRLKEVEHSDGTNTDYWYNDLHATFPSPLEKGSGMLQQIDGPWTDDTINYTYDELGRMASRKIGEDAVTPSSFSHSISSISYDGLGRVDEIQNDLGTFQYHYVSGEPSGRIDYWEETSVTNFDFKVDYDYLANGSGGYLKTIENTVGSSETLVSRFDYTYDAAGRIKTWKKQLGENGPGNPAQFMEFLYDFAGQLTNADNRDDTATGTLNETLTYGYDRAGNRTAKVVDGVPNTASFNSRNQLTTGDHAGTVPFVGTVDEFATVKVNGQQARLRNNESGGYYFESLVDLNPSGDTQVRITAKDKADNESTQVVTIDDTTGNWVTLVYDDNGNTKTKTLNPGTGSAKTITYEWDRENRLTAVVNDGVRTEFDYNGLGQRWKIIEDAETQSPKTRYFILCGASICQERSDKNDDSDPRNYFAQGEHRKDAAGDPKYYYTRDHLGSVRELVDTSGNVKVRYDYSPYGVRTKLSGTIACELGFTGHFTHEDSNVVLTYYRGYDSELGRWLSPDPLGEILSDSANVYAYVTNDPIDWYDPDGLQRRGRGPRPNPTFDPRLTPKQNQARARDYFRRARDKRRTEEFNKAAEAARCAANLARRRLINEVVEAAQHGHLVGNSGSNRTFTQIEAYQIAVRFLGHGWTFTNSGHGQSANGRRIVRWPSIKPQQKGTARECQMNLIRRNGQGNEISNYHVNVSTYTGPTMSR